MSYFSPASESGLKTDFRKLGGFTRTGVTGHDDHLIILYQSDDVILLTTYGQLLRIRDFWNFSGPGSGIFHCRRSFKSKFRHRLRVRFGHGISSVPENPACLGKDSVTVTKKSFLQHF